MQLDKIEFLNGSSNIESVERGYSGAYKYTFIKNGKKYFLKIGKFKIDNNLENTLKSNGISHPSIIEFGKYNDDMNYIIEEYIVGKDLKEELNKHSIKYIYEYGFKIGEQYRNLRHIYPDKPMTEEKYKEYIIKVKKRVIELEVLIKNNSTNLTIINRKFLNYVIFYLNNNMDTIKHSYLIYGHTDIKPSNFLKYKSEIIATDIENTDYKELSMSMIWSFARNDLKDDKNLAFTRGYLDSLFNFNVPEVVLNCFNYTYLFNMSNYFIEYLKKSEYKKLTNFIQHIKSNYIINNEIKISEKLRSPINIKYFDILKDCNMTLVNGSHNPYNLTFKCQNKDNIYFLKCMEMSSSHYEKSIASYNLLNECNIPISPVLKHGCLIKDKYYYVISKFIQLDQMDKCLENTFADGFRCGELVAAYLLKLKTKKISCIKTYDSKDLFKDIKEYIETIYEKNEVIEILYWSKTDLISYIKKYIKAFDDEPISLIHADVKFENILYDGQNICFVDNESLEYSYDSINFLYNIHQGFLDIDNKHYKGFVNGYLKYMNNGVIPNRIQNQVKVLLIYYVLRIAKNVIENKSDKSGIASVLNSCQKYIDKDSSIEWLS